MYACWNSEIVLIAYTVLAYRNSEICSCGSRNSEFWLYGFRNSELWVNNFRNSGFWSYGFRNSEPWTQGFWNSELGSQDSGIILKSGLPVSVPEVVRHCTATKCSSVVSFEVLWFPNSGRLSLLFFWTPPVSIMNKVPYTSNECSNVVNNVECFDSAFKSEI